MVRLGIIFFIHMETQYYAIYRNLSCLDPFLLSPYTRRERRKTIWSLLKSNPGPHASRTNTLTTRPRLLWWIKNLTFWSLSLATSAALRRLRVALPHLAGDEVLADGEKWTWLYLSALCRVLEIEATSPSEAACPFCWKQIEFCETLKCCRQDPIDGAEVAFSNIRYSGNPNTWVQVLITSNNNKMKTHRPDKRR